jgi:NAD(P)-dependent dehydrogenase (short-subunit alcohol dehydrogenase family)
VKTILVTGSTDGVGRLVARRLAAQGDLVLLHGRDEGRGRALLAEIEGAGGRAELHLADLASLAEVRRLGREILERHPRLDILINNAGIGFGASGRRETSADGIELRFAVNYLSGFLLTSLLMPALRSAAPSRIVNVASAGQHPIDFADPMLEHAYEGSRAYRQSKLAQIMATFDIARALEGSGVTVNALHPATFMDTTMVREVGIRPASTVAEGADAILNLATSPALEGRTGLYFNGLGPARANPQAYDEEARAKLRALSLELVAEQ